jgi:hypothetical protein
VILAHISHDSGLGRKGFEPPTVMEVLTLPTATISEKLHIKNRAEKARRILRHVSSQPQVLTPR